jgi:hypothetical protein
MDILRHAENVTVVAPAALRDQVAARLDTAARSYRTGRALVAESAPRSARWSREGVVARKAARGKAN